MLIGWLLAAPGSSGRIFAGYAGGMSLILVISVVTGSVGFLIPKEYLGYLGVIPLGLGAKMLIDRFRRRGGNSAVASTGHMQRVTAGSVVLTMLSNGVDSVLTFAPLLADSKTDVDLSILVAFVLMIFLWYKLARYATTRARRISALRAAGEWIAPIVMIIVGLYIFDNTATDVIPGS